MKFWTSDIRISRVTTFKPFIQSRGPNTNQPPERKNYLKVEISLISMTFFVKNKVYILSEKFSVSKTALILCSLFQALQIHPVMYICLHVHFNSDSSSFFSPFLFSSLQFNWRCYQRSHRVVIFLYVTPDAAFSCVKSPRTSFIQASWVTLFKTQAQAGWQPPESWHTLMSELNVAQRFPGWGRSRWGHCGLLCSATHFFNVALIKIRGVRQHWCSYLPVSEPLTGVNTKSCWEFVTCEFSKLSDCPSDCCKQ